nr:MAG TPA: hypothetical protein [Bacteriophage sp.]
MALLSVDYLGLILEKLICPILLEGEEEGLKMTGLDFH